MKKFLSLLRHTVCLTLLLPCFLLFSQIYCAVKASKSARVTQSKSVAGLAPAQVLQWIPSKHCACAGHFYTLPEIKAKPHPGPITSEGLSLSAQGAVVLNPNGSSIFNGGVILQQPGRLIKAGQAIVTRSSSSGDITVIKLKGKVKVAQGHMLLVADRAVLYLKRREMQVNNAWYRLVLPQKISSSATYQLWGFAKHLVKNAADDITLRSASFSTCPPASADWQLHAGTLQIYPQKKHASAKNVWLTLKGVPIFYFPYFSFPLDNARKSGFLMPNISDSSQSGFEFGVPYYWNIAPNYDATITPTYFASRGFQVSTLFRFLTSRSKGQLQLNMIPRDSRFADFKAAILNKGIVGKGAYLQELRKDSLRRGYLGVQYQTQFSSKLKMLLNLNYVTDPYYLRDYSLSAINSSRSQLVNDIALKYAGYHWQWALLVQAFQTLHMIDEEPVMDQYRRLPELDVSGGYPHAFKKIALGLQAQLVNFAYQSDYSFAPTSVRSLGMRLHLRPYLSSTFSFLGGKLQPELALDALSYAAKLPVHVAGVVRQRWDHSQAIPMFKVKSHWRFARDVHLAKHKYYQTLIPEFQYVYIPYTDQSSNPIFDSYVKPLTFSNLFSWNQFAGSDRLQNTSQLDMGFATGMYRASDGQPVLRGGIGMAYYYAARRVCLTTGCDPQEAGVSPLVAQVVYDLATRWDISSHVSWDINHKQIQSADIGAGYRFSKEGQVHLGYLNVKPSTGLPVGPFDLTQQTRLLDTAIAMPLSKNVSILGDYYYNLDKNYAESYFFGIQYSSCCWASRLIYRHYFVAIDPSNPNARQYENAVYLQLMFKGLGAVSSGHPDQLMAKALPGYDDIFNQN